MPYLDPTLAPATPISGAAAYRRYIELARPFVDSSGGELVLQGRGGPGYVKILGHRTAALADSRLLPMIETDSL
jgi:hypothetical protein